jgi:site-specific DNA-methyltransferase (adenine-specific)
MKHIQQQGKYMIYNEDCIVGSKRYIKSDSVDLGIFDPPFGIKETKFDQLYNRNKKNIINGYIEAPNDYYAFSKEWISEAKRILKQNGSMYIISGWSNLKHILNAIDDLDLNIINHIIWKFNFGIATKNKFVTSHYHILYIKKDNSIPTFNTYCRFGSQEKDQNDKSLNYQDLEDVFIINKEYSPNKIKNQNKLPNALIEKLILYSSNIGDTVCDFFMGNFTTAMVAKKL